MSRGRFVGLEQAETAVHGRGINRRRAVLEEELAAALAEGDREIVSRVRGELQLLHARRTTETPRGGGG